MLAQDIFGQLKFAFRHHLHGDLFYQKLDGYNEDWSWWHTWCPVCKRPLDVSVWQANREYTEPSPSKREFPRPQIVEEPEQRHGDDELYRLRNNLVVRRLGMDTSSEYSYEVVWPSEDAGRKIYLAHHGPSDPFNPLNHLGGWLGPCYDIVSLVIKIEDGQVYIPKPLKLKSRFAYAVALWGNDRGLILGALVLAGALERTGSKLDRILLHTDELPDYAHKILAVAWTLTRVEYIEAARGLFYEENTRFD